jgi:Family of unknown function (DUF6309)
MEILARVDVEEVVKKFRSEHSADTLHEANTNSDAEMRLMRAEALLGRWGKVVLNRSDVRSIILPWHVSEGGGIALVPQFGLTVAQAAAKLLPMTDRYAAESPVCWTKLLRACTAPLSAVFLSTKAIDVPDYEQLQTAEGLVHLDGLHRLVSWELNGLLTTSARVEAYIAGLPTTSVRAPEDH